MTLPRNLYLDTRRSKPVWRYVPPKAAIEAGIVKRTQFDKEELAIRYAEAMNHNIDVWRNDLKELQSRNEKATVSMLLSDYYTSKFFTDLADVTKKNYRIALNRWLSTRIHGAKELRNYSLCDLPVPTCQRLYDNNADNSVESANVSLTIYRVLFNFAIRRGYTTHNPFTFVKKRKTKQRKVMWKQEQVRAFLHMAFSKFEWRNVGVMVYCAYEWGQRVGDMRVLQWDSYNVDTGILTLTQSKRGAEVKIPTSEGLQGVLKQQFDTFGWQKYVAPTLRRDRKNRCFYPYSLDKLSQIAKDIMQAAGLPDELRISDLRRTAITEMVEVGVPTTQIMSVSGHRTVESLNPYIRPTLRAATNAQSQRGIPQRLIDRELYAAPKDAAPQLAVPHFRGEVFKPIWQKAGERK